MADIFIYGLFIIAIIILLLLLNWYIKWKAYGKQESIRKKALESRRRAAAKGLIITCPLCNSTLLPGEELISKVYRPMNVPDQLCTINGCPHCYPAPAQGIRRVCPVCAKNVPVKDGHLIARLFNKPGGKKHVIVVGCTECCRHGESSRH